MKKVIIVGGGIAGLTAGIYARQSGFDTTIFEMHSIPGGNSTSWQRKGYLFEGGMHWLTGSSAKAPLNRVWREIGALQANNPIYNRDPFLTYMGEGQPICLYRDPKRLGRHLLEVSPKDAPAIRALVKDIKACSGMSVPVTDIKGVKVKRKSSFPLPMMFAAMRMLPAMKRLAKITAGEYAKRFQHPGIRTLLGSVVGREDYSALAVAFTLGGLSAGDGGYPKGGSLRMAQNMADTFAALGGAMAYRSRVQRIAVENGRAAGVIVGGSLYSADAVIVTADARAAIDTLFETPLNERWTDEMRRDIKPLNCTFICLGVEADLCDLPENPIFPLERPFTFSGAAHTSLGVNNYAGFEGYAPPGCTALTCFLGGDSYDFWQSAKQDGTYHQKKQALAETAIEALSQAIPQIKGKVAVWDVATPLTYERYCGTYRGSWMSVMGTDNKRQQYPCKSESIGGLYFAGQRIMLPGGLPVAAVTGRQAVQHVCLDQDMVFQGDVR